MMSNPFENTDTQAENTKDPAYLAIRFGLSTFMIGTLFRIMHWPNGIAISIVATAAIILLFYYRFLSIREKGLVEIVSLILVHIWASGLVVSIFHLPYLFGAAPIITKITFILWTVLELVFSSRGAKRHVLLYVLWIIGIMITFAGATFKTMHWPMANIFLIVGIGLLAVMFPLDAFLTRSDQQ